MRNKIANTIRFLLGSYISNLMFPIKEKELTQIDYDLAHYNWEVYYNNDEKIE